MQYAKIAQKLRGQILRFSGELSFGLPKPARRFIAEMIYGIQARQSVRLTEIGRALEEPISLRKTGYRLCRQLQRRGLWERLTGTLCRMAASRIQEMTLLILDLSDISKKYARKMEYLALVQAAATFATVYLNLRTKLRVLTGHVLLAARRVFGIPDFRFYALADGIKAYLFGQKRGLYGCFSTRDPETGQQWLFSP